MTDDPISRQAAIDALDGEIKLKDSDDVDNVARYIQQVARKINELPSIERKKGKWIDTHEEEEWYAREYRCSECGDTMLGVANFCPNCGADMRGEKE